MTGEEFVRISLTLSCLLGPPIGFVSAIAWLVWEHVKFHGAIIYLGEDKELGQ